MDNSQAAPSYDAEIQRLHTEVQTAQALAKDWERKADQQRGEIDALKWREMHYTVNAGDSPLYRHSEVIWLRTRATDSQISGMLKSRDDAVIARSAADREVGQLTGERDELSRQLVELKKKRDDCMQLPEEAQTLMRPQAVWEQELSELRASAGMAVERWKRSEQERRAGATRIAALEGESAITSEVIQAAKKCLAVLPSDPEMHARLVALSTAVHRHKQACVSSNQAEQDTTLLEETHAGRPFSGFDGLAAFLLGTCPRCGKLLNNVSPGISVVAGGIRVCTSCVAPGETELLRARSLT